MSSKRSSVGVATLDGELYCVGGNDGSMCMASGERFNARRNSWEPIAAMETRRWVQLLSCLLQTYSIEIIIITRSTHELIDVDGYLYTLGGNDGASSLNTGSCSCWTRNTISIYLLIVVFVNFINFRFSGKIRSAGGWVVNCIVHVLASHIGRCSRARMLQFGKGSGANDQFMTSNHDSREFIDRSHSVVASVIVGTEYITVFSLVLQINVNLVSKIVSFELDQHIARAHASHTHSFTH